MAFRNYNNNENNRGPSNTTYSSISFSNPTPESNIPGSRFSISYLNKVMKITIAKVNAQSSNSEYATYDNDNAASIYLSATKAYILSDAIKKMINGDEEWSNVCVETNTGLIKVAKAGNNYLIAINTMDNSGAVSESVYETKSVTHVFATDYTGGSDFNQHIAKDVEINTFVMTLDEYYKASSYAIAASVMEASMYKRQGQYDLIRAIAEKNGIQVNNGGNGSSGGGYNNRSSFGINNRNNSTSSNQNQKQDNFASAMNPPSGYDTSTFDDIVNDME